MHVPHLRKKVLILGIVAIAMLLVGIAAGIYGQSSATKRIDYFDLERRNFIAESHGLQRMEVWAVPEKTMTEAQWKSYGLMKRISHWGAWAKWEIPIPSRDPNIMQIMVRGYDASGTEIDRVSLPWIGNQKLMEAVWGN